MIDRREGKGISSRQKLTKITNSFHQKTLEAMAVTTFNGSAKKKCDACVCVEMKIMQTWSNEYRSRVYEGSLGDSSNFSVGLKSLKIKHLGNFFKGKTPQRN